MASEHGMTIEARSATYADAGMGGTAPKTKKPAAVKRATGKRFGQIEGDHHRAWVLDQVSRELLGNQYHAWVEKMKAGKDGPDSYTYDEGIAP